MQEQDKSKAALLAAVALSGVASYANIVEIEEKNRRANERELYQKTMSKTFIPGKEKHRLESAAGVHYHNVNKGQEVKALTATGKVGRNQLCPCGSKKKFKHCCSK